jgi:hypothetical protein
MFTWCTMPVPGGQRGTDEKPAGPSEGGAGIALELKRGVALNASDGQNVGDRVVDHKLGGGTSG